MGAGSSRENGLEVITINNTSGGSLDFHFFQYADFDLNDTPGGDSAVFANANTVLQSEGALSVSETVITPAASHREIDFYPATRDELNDGVATTLSDTPIGTVVGPGDVTWAFQWDFTVQPGSTFLISKDKRLSGVPEPTACVLLSIGVGLLLAARRKR